MYPVGPVGPVGPVTPCGPTTPGVRNHNAALIKPPPLPSVHLILIKSPTAIFKLKSAKEPDKSIPDNSIPLYALFFQTWIVPLASGDCDA